MFVHFLLLIIVIFLCFNTRRNPYKAQSALSISAFLLAIYWAFMYDYGLDYWNYYDIFYHDRLYGDERGEPFFWNLFFFFGNYYQFVVFYGVILALSIYYVAKLNMPYTYYWYFFLIFLLHPSLCYNMTYVYRTTLGSCVIWLAITFFCSR